jgi:hypothetical protein
MEWLARLIAADREAEASSPSCRPTDAQLRLGGALARRTIGRMDDSLSRQRDLLELAVEGGFVFVTASCAGGLGKSLCLGFIGIVRFRHA